MSERQSEPLRAFLRDHVSSFEQLRALLYLAGASAGSRTAVEVADGVGLPLELAESALEELARAGQLVRAITHGSSLLYSYAPAQDSQRALVSDLGRAYAEQPLTIIRMMNDNALGRIRSSAARRLAEAFRLDREKK